MTTPETHYLTIEEAAEHLNLSRRTIAGLIAAERLPVHRFGRAVRIKRTTLDAFAEAAATAPLPGRESGYGA